MSKAIIRIHRPSPFRIAFTLAFCLIPAGLLPAQTPPPAAGGTPQGMSFKDQLAIIKKEPLLKAEDGQNAEKKPLTPQQRQSVEKAAKLMQEANQDRAKGDYQSALTKAREALKIRMDVYSAAHYQTIYSIALEKTLSRYVASPPAELIELTDADRLQAKAEDAYEKCEYASALNMANKALSIRERILGRGYHELGECYRIIGSCQTELSSLDEADKSLERGVDSSEKAYGKYHPVLARILDRQGWLYTNKGDLVRALSCLQTAVRIYSLTTGDTLEAAEAMDNLGTVLVLRGDATEGLNTKLRALVIRQALVGDDSKEAGISYSNLAWMYSRIGMPAEVVPLRQKSQAIFQKLLGPDHPYTSTETINLGIALQNERKVDEAIALYKQAVDADAKRTAPVDAKLVSRITRLGVAYFEANRRDEADATLKNAFEKAKEVQKLGNTAAAAGEVRGIADVYEAYRMYDEGVKILSEAIEWDRKGKPDEASLSRVQLLGNMLIALGRAKEARDLLQAAVPQGNEVFGRGDRRMAGLLIGLAYAQERSGDYTAAEHTCDEVLRISESKFGPESRGNAVALRQMGRIYLLEKKLDLARFSLEDCKKITEKYQDVEPVEMIRTLWEFADLQSAEGKRADAVKSLRDALDLCRKLAQKTKTPHMDGMMAKTLHNLLVAIGSDSAPDKDALRSELRTILNRLQAARAIDAENREWIKAMESGKL